MGKNHKLRGLPQDCRREEAEYFRRTEVIPVSHTLVLREPLVENHPWVIESRLAAFGLPVHIVAGRDMEFPYRLLGA